jgi:uncharacterized protein Smg (DUF494 family)
LKDDFLDIVSVIVKQMAEDEGANPRERGIIERLLDEGYDLMDIDDALSWFEGLAGIGDELKGGEFWPGFRGMRVQSKHERDRMSPQAFSYLMKLNTAGLVDDSFREALIDKILDLSISDFGLEQMKALIGLALYSKGTGPQDIALGLMPGRGPRDFSN